MNLERLSFPWAWTKWTLYGPFPLKTANNYYIFLNTEMFLYLVIRLKKSPFPCLCLWLTSHISQTAIMITPAFLPIQKLITNILCWMDESTQKEQVSGFAMAYISVSSGSLAFGPTLHPMFSIPSWQLTLANQPMCIPITYHNVR